MSYTCMHNHNPYCTTLHLAVYRRMHTSPGCTELIIRVSVRVKVKVCNYPGRSGVRLRLPDRALGLSQAKAV